MKRKFFKHLDDLVKLDVKIADHKLKQLKGGEIIEYELDEG